MHTFFRQFGPGLLWAAAAIGVSHLVQSTRAGADAGFALAGVVVLALVLKYPFFEYGPRYAATTGESLVEGYLRVGRWALWLYLGITLATALIVQLAVVLFTAFLLARVLGVAWPLPVTAGLLIAFCAALLRIGRYRGLDWAIKVVLVLLAISTLAAGAIILPRADASTLSLWPPPSAGVSLAFVLALVGWMPSAIDISVWSSLWTLAKGRTAGTRASLAHALLDFRIGYVGTGIMAFAFLTLGAGVMYRSGESFSAQGTGFSVQLVELYARTLGAWTKPLVFAAVLTTMFSTALTVVDGFPRAIARAVRVLASGGPVSVKGDDGPVYWWAVGALGALTVLVLALFIGSLTTMVDFATTVSFLTAPVLGYLNLRVVTRPGFPAAAHPGRGLIVLSYVGLLLLGGTAVVYLVSVFTR
jgi:Mn2+/Fe2+ NRAMP family transporter